MFALSYDEPDALAAYADEFDVTFPLLSDPDGSAAAKLGAIRPGAGWTNRVTFIYDEKGVLRYRDDEVSVDTHGEDLAEIVLRLREE